MNFENICYFQPAVAESAFTEPAVAESVFTDPADSATAGSVNADSATAGFGDEIRKFPQILNQVPRAELKFFWIEINPHKLSKWKRILLKFKWFYTFFSHKVISFFNRFLSILHI